VLTEHSIDAVNSIIASGKLKSGEFCIVSSLYRIDKQSRILKLWKKTDKIGFFENYLHPTWYVSKNVYEKYGLYDTQYRIASDYDYYMRLLENNVEIIQSETSLAKHREGGISENYVGAKEVIRIKKFYKGGAAALMLGAQNLIFKWLIIVRGSLRKCMSKS
jgi:hypothetical protein